MVVVLYRLRPASATSLDPIFYLYRLREKCTLKVARV
jgi:hypothetical protein